MKRNSLYIIAGASGCGKTTLIQRIVYIAKLCALAPKYTTRPTRPDEKKNGKIIEDDAKYKDQELMEQICDVLYETNDYKYGFITSEVNKVLEKDDAAVIISDIRAITMLKEKVEEAGFVVRIIYLSSKMDSPSAFVKTWQNRVNNSILSDKIQSNKIMSNVQTMIDNNEKFNTILQSKTVEKSLIEEVEKYCEQLQSLLPDWDSSRVRSEKIRLMYTRYVHNISLFDHVILNYGDTIDDAFEQAKKIIETHRHENKCKRKTGPVVFIICAAPKSGKGTLMENLNIMGTSQIQITPKYAGREKKDEDKRDGMIALGKENFDKRFHNPKTQEAIWKWEFHKGKSGAGTEYAVLVEDIKSRLCKGVSQIFISNFEQLERLQTNKDLQDTLNDVKGRFVFVYLHRVRTDEEIKEHLSAEQDKIVGVTQTYNDYIKNVDKIDHVIINPSYATYSEDLHDQMMTLIELYSGKRI